MKTRTLDEIRQIWGEYFPLSKVDSFILKIQRHCRFLEDLEERIGRAVRGGNTPCPLLAREVHDYEQGKTFQGTDIADFGWNLENWEYWARKKPEDKINLYRLAIVAGHFMEEEKMHSGMKDLIKYAEHYVK